MTIRKFWSDYRFPLTIILSIILGSIIGVIMGENASILSPLGDIFLNLMFTAVVPLVFATIASAVGNMTNMKRLGKIIGYMLLVFVATGLVAAVVIIIAVKIWPPAQGVTIPLETTQAGQTVSLAQRLVEAVTVSDFNLLLSRSKMLPLIVFAVMLCLLWEDCGGIQGWALVAILFIALYNGERGWLRLKNFFYIFYPAHMAVIYLLQIVMEHLT